MAEKKENRVAFRGFASMTTETKVEIARKGGLVVSANRAHMAEIGRRGGSASGASRRRNRDANILQPLVPLT